MSKFKKCCRHTLRWMLCAPVCFACASSEQESPDFAQNLSSVMSNGASISRIAQALSVGSSNDDNDDVVISHDGAGVMRFDKNVSMTCDNGAIKGDIHLSAKYGPLEADIHRVEIRAYLDGSEGLVGPEGEVIPVQLGHIGDPVNFPEDQLCNLNNIEPHVVDSWNRNCGVLYGGGDTIEESYVLRAYGECEGESVYQATLVFDFIVHRSTPGQAQNLVVNGGFENPAIGNTNQKTWILTNAMPGWVPHEHETYGPIEIDRNGVGSTPKPVEGHQAIELDSHTRRGLNRTSNSRVRQTVYTEFGHTYDLSFSSSPRRNNGTDTDNFEVWWAGQQLDLNDAQVTQQSNNWKRYTFTGLRSGGQLTIVEFRGAGRSDTYGAALDDVVVTQNVTCE